MWSRTQSPSLLWSWPSLAYALSAPTSSHGLALPSCVSLSFPTSSGCGLHSWSKLRVAKCTCHGSILTSEFCSLVNCLPTSFGFAGLCLGVMGTQLRKTCAALLHKQIENPLSHKPEGLILKRPTGYLLVWGRIGTANFLRARNGSCQTKAPDTTLSNNISNTEVDMRTFMVLYDVCSRKKMDDS